MNTVTVGYAVSYAVSALATAGFALHVLRSEMRARRRFAALFGLLAAWTLVSLVALFVSDRTAQFAFALCWAAVSVLVVFSWVCFALAYTRSEYARPLERGFALAAVALVVGVVTDPLHHAYWGTLSYRTTPFPHLSTTVGPLLAVALAYTVLGIGVATYTLGRLFVRSRHRPSRAVVVLAGGVVVGVLPIVASFFDVGLFPASNGNALGVGVFALVVGYAVRRQGFVDLAPVARDVAVDHLEDPLLAVDSDHRIIDYNPAAAPLLDAADTGIGDPLADAFSELDPDALDEEDAAIVTRTINGNENHYSAAISSVRERDTVEGYTVVLSDVTEREAARRRLEVQNERLTEFADVVSHDLRNLLSIAAGRVDLAREESDVTHLDDAADTLARMDEIIDGMRERAKRGDVVDDPERVELAAIAADAWRMVDGPDADLDLKADGTVTAVSDLL